MPAMWTYLLVATLLHATLGDPASVLQYPTPASPQNLEKLISAIEERLRALDSYSDSRRYNSPKCEQSLEAQTRKLGVLETKLTRLETVLTFKADKITESLTSKALKEELSKEQLGRKIDVIYERLNHRMSFIESRIETSINKLQNSLETTLTKTNNQLEHLEKTSNDMENDLIELGTSVEETKTVLHSLNSSLRANESCDHTERIDTVSNYIQKILSLSQEATMRGKTAEEMSRRCVEIFNTTRRELQDGVKAVKANRRVTCPTIPEDTLEDIVDKTESMKRQNEVNYQKLNRTLEEVKMRQEQYQDNCHRLQLKEPQIEDRIAEILEKIWDFSENRTFTTERNYETLLEYLKAHHNLIVRTVAQTTSTVVKLSHQVSSDFKSLYTNHPATDKIDQIIVSLQELQDEFQELNDTILDAHLTPSQSQFLLNNTATILRTIQNLNENMTTILDKLSDYYHNIASPYQPESGDISSKILQIFNMTEADLLSANDRVLARGNEQNLGSSAQVEDIMTQPDIEENAKGNVMEIRDQATENGMKRSS